MSEHTKAAIKHRTPKRSERVYRVVGREFVSDSYVKTWTYKRLSDAEFRAKQLSRSGRLLAFDVADVEWRPTHQSAFPRHTQNGSHDDA